MKILLLAIITISLLGMSWMEEEEESRKCLTIKGTFDTERDIKDLDIGVVWFVDNSKGDHAIFGTTLSGVDAPGAFTIRVKPPTKDQQISVGNVSIGIAFLVAFEDLNANGELDGEHEIIGGVEDYCITYLDGDLNATLDAAGKDDIYTLRQLKQGLHLSKAVSPDEHQHPTPFDDLLPVKRSTRIVLKIADKLKFPNWT
ncbi:MAG: hypothetical protein MK212_02790 [Saprospiraceae bacterium]|nr:hypothetical protein [Saprospiraceae bacterium]